MRKILLFILLIVLLFNFVSAEEITPDIGVVFDRVSFDFETRELTINVIIKNETSNFIDGLEYDLMFFEGDELATQGLLFDPLDFIYLAEGNLVDLTPNEITALELKIIPPKEIIQGNYFFKFFVADESGFQLNFDYSKNPVFITGNNRMIPMLNGYVKTSHGYDPFLLGWNIDPTEAPQLVIPFEENPKFEEFLNKEKLFGKIEVFSLAFGSEKIQEDNLFVLNPMNEIEKGKSIVYTINPNKQMIPGPYEVRLYVVDAQGKEIVAPVLARWLVEGFYARLFEINSSTNYYPKLSPVDLNVSVVAWVPQESAFVKVKAEIVGKNIEGKEIKLTFEKETTVISEILSFVDFSDEIIMENISVKEINLTLTDSLGNVFDEKKFIITDAGQKILEGEPYFEIKSGSETGTGDTKDNENVMGEFSLVFIIAIVIIILLLFGVVYFKGGKNVKK